MPIFMGVAPGQGEAPFSTTGSLATLSHGGLEVTMRQGI